jgi:mannitol/fructose-specific phosphotransferase system IIA component
MKQFSKWKSTLILLLGKFLNGKNFVVDKKSYLNLMENEKALNIYLGFIIFIH